MVNALQMHKLLLAWVCGGLGAAFTLSGAPGQFRHCAGGGNHTRSAGRGHSTIRPSPGLDLMTDNSREFRNALGCFATGVTVVTTRRADGVPVGITANSFSSVSLDPPLVLWCIDKSSDCFDDFQAADRFAINVLAADDMNVSNDMARTGRDGVGDHGFSDGPVLGLPVLERALAHFECEVEHRHAGGDHVILVGRVKGMQSRQDGDPLLYFRGKYAAITS